MRIMTLVAVLALGLGGCTVAREFGAGFKAGVEAEGVNMIAEAAANKAADALDKKFGEKIGDLGDVIRDLPKNLPEPVKPSDPMEGGVWFGLAYLLSRGLMKAGGAAIKKRNS